MYALTHCKIKKDHDSELGLIVTGPCVVTGEEYTVKCAATSFFRYWGGEYIQNAFDYLSDDDREFLLSGYSPKGWSQTFESLEFDEEE
jgi:hypothetical protein